MQVLPPFGIQLFIHDVDNDDVVVGRIVAARVRIILTSCYTTKRRLQHSLSKKKEFSIQAHLVGTRWKLIINCRRIKNPTTPLVLCPVCALRCFSIFRTFDANVLGTFYASVPFDVCVAQLWSIRNRPKWRRVFFFFFLIFENFSPTP